MVSGHEHDYQRMRPVNGVTYVVSGGGSHARRTGAGPLTAASFGAPHFLDIGITGDQLRLRAVLADGRVGDDWELHHERRAEPPVDRAP